MISQKLASFLLKKLGWHFTKENYSNENKLLLLLAPHTSFKDFVIGRMYLWSIGYNASVIIKKEFFFFPLGYLLKKLGALPIERAKGKSAIDGFVSLYQKHEKIHIVIAPEGTRQKTTRWKKGFYHIAQKANVPVQLSYIDWKTKTVGLGPCIDMSKESDEVLQEVYAFYKDMEGKHPDQFATGLEKKQ